MEHSTRYVDQPTSWSTRLSGMGGVMLACLLIVGGALLTWRTYTAAPAAATLSVFDVAAPTAPPEPPKPPSEAERQEKQKPVPRPEQPKIVSPEIQLPSDNPVPAPVAQPDPDPPIERTTAPERQPAPPAPKVSANVAETWEGKVLARLNQHRRYPRTAMARRQQGVPYVRFVMDRKGHVLSATLERSSGFPELDREAVALPRRAQPLPKPPANTRPEQAIIELVVPVEFFVAR
ncbi:energy transducer TonB [Sphingomonas sp.]|uniref:energy transducer TonB n=1 Tax=Sphingomonas sp. TaxID=28214 RepID=UPI003D6C7347